MRERSHKLKFQRYEYIFTLSCGHNVSRQLNAQDVAEISQNSTELYCDTCNEGQIVQSILKTDTPQENT